ncbi:MAG: 3-dehydroquinate synthase [Desulfobacterales bacterium S5133MH4]|nr:MAG: 3-dehydroquinate synthase [Desulfobacterales bacterium S5133MH4]
MDRIKVNVEKSCKDSYEIFIGEDIIGREGLISRMKNHADRFVIITDSHVNPLYGEKVRERLGEADLPVDIIEIPAGESSKSLNTVLDVAKQLVRLKVGRKSLLIALGGGVVGDLAGFVASIYMRSVPYVQIPTTLLAQVDSSVGGKTGVDLPEGKNLLGTFYQPKAVYADLVCLKTLSDRDFANGMAEIIKYGIIGDHNLFELLEHESSGIKKADPSLMRSLVGRSCKIKAEIVEMDEKELGLRRILNFGHTIGHAIEAASGYSLSHGEAVAIGMVGAAKISNRLDYLDSASYTRIVDLIKEYKLPTRIPAGFDTAQITAFMATDKKVVGGRIHFVLVKEIGTPFVTPEIPPDVVEGAIEELQG